MFAELVGFFVAERVVERAVPAKADVLAELPDELRIERERGAAEIEHRRRLGHFRLRRENARRRPGSLSGAPVVEHLDGRATLGQLESAGEPDQPAADDDHVLHAVRLSCPRPARKSRGRNSSMPVRIDVMRVSPARGDPLDLPAYATEGSSGMVERALVPTGIAIAIPQGFEGQVRPRSGLALREGITCLNTPGTLDSDYRGEVSVILVNFSQQPVSLKRGDRIAQLVIARVERAELAVSTALPGTSRGEGGFGHTGRT